MKPLHLTVAGLHSYRAPVSVDFEELGRFGLFGIFGPIGAGKSTLLDAITLALYGLVDRVVGRSRRGLVHAVDPTVRCEVRFRFAVGSGRPTDPRRVYEVHRQYRDEGGVAQRVGSRLIEVPDAPGRPPITLAEKETDVNAQIEELVGLSAEDFLRAVVLPQGRFVQLLQLKGQERRQMLQRIFRLQAYGEDLRAKVRDRQVAVRARTAEVRGELAGLGDASPAQVQRALAAAQRARSEREALETEHHASSARAEVEGRRRDRSRRRDGLTADLAALDADRDEIEAESRALAQAERLRPHAPALAAADRARDRATALTAAAREAGDARAELTAAHAVRAAEAAESRDHLERDGPRLRDRVARLQDAARDAREARAEAARADVWEAELPASVAEEQGARSEADRLRVRVSDLDKDRRKTRRDLGKARVEPSERERVARASRAADAVAAARRLLEEARAEELASAGAVLIARQRCVEAEADGDAAHRALAALDEHRPPAPPDTDDLVRRVEELRGRRAQRDERAQELAAAAVARDKAAESVRASGEADTGAQAEVRSAASVLRGATRALEDAEAALAAHTQRTAARALAMALAPGVACAVCGSSHHPAPAEQPAGDPAPAVDAHRLGHKRAAERRERALEARARAASAVEAATNALAAAEERRVRAASALEQLPGDDALEEAVALLEAAREMARSARVWREAVEQAQLVAERARVPVAGARATLEAAEAEATRTRELRLARGVAEGTAWATFDADRGELTLFDVNTAAQRLEARDREVHALTERAELLDHEREAAARAADDERARADRAAVAASRAREHGEASRSRAVALADAARAVAGDDDAEAALDASRAEADGAARTAAAHGLAERAAADALTAAAERHAAAVSASDAAEGERARGEGALAEVAARLLPGAGDALAALREALTQVPDEAEVAFRRERVAAWERSVATLRAAIAELGVDDGAPLDDGAWAALEAAVAAVADRLEAARDAAVLAARAAEEASERAPRWAALEAASAALEGEGGRLDELAHVLRGDRFVEYVANDHLAELTDRASEHLSTLTEGRYHLALDADLTFVVRDEDLGGVTRPVTGLSGGESFLTALALALALSSLVQARSSRPLGFFFLDEGFGTLDPDALDRVMSAIEQLRGEDRLIGLISHVAEVRDRVPRFLEVQRSPGGASSVRMVDA